MTTAGDLAAFSVRQENALNLCEAQRDEAVQMLRDRAAAEAALNAALKPRGMLSRMKIP